MSKLTGEYKGTKEVFTVLDLETTSLDPKEGQIIEIAAIRTDLEREYGRLDMRVALNDNLTELSDFTTELTGIETADLKGGVTEAVAMFNLAAFSVGTTVVAQYAPFDLSYLEPRGFVPEFFLDTRTITRLIDPTVKSASLMPTYERLFGEKFEDAHRAMADVEATVRVLKEQLNRAEAAGLTRRDIQNVVIDAADRPLRFTPKNAIVKKMDLPKRQG
jgi:DNA polymerase III alpha subunit (gram-positive type)